MQWLTAVLRLSFNLAKLPRRFIPRLHTCYQCLSTPTVVISVTLAAYKRQTPYIRYESTSMSIMHTTLCLLWLHINSLYRHARLQVLLLPPLAFLLLLYHIALATETRHEEVGEKATDKAVLLTNSGALTALEHTREAAMGEAVVGEALEVVKVRLGISRVDFVHDLLCR